MDEGTLLAAQAAAWHFDIQLFADDDDPELGPPFEVDIDALGDDPAKLKSMLGKALHNNKKIREEAGKRRRTLRTVEGERDELKTKLTTAETDRDKHKTDLETANRSSGQHVANFKKSLIDRDLTAALKDAGMIEQAIPLALPAIKRDGITCADETFEIGGIKEAIEAYKGENAQLFGTITPTPQRKGTSPGVGPSGGGTGGGNPVKIDYMDTTKSLEQLQRESDIAKYGRPAANYQ